jgi:uncharacterized protein
MGVLFKNDFDYSSIEKVDHRPYPAPETPWIMTQTWHDLLFLHWPVDQAQLQSLLPAGLELDTFDNQAYVSITPFHMSNLAPRGIPAIPGMSSMPEINVRTYVKGKGYPGIFFFSLDAANSFAVGAARTMFFLPYFSAQMSVHETDGWIHYQTRRTSPTVPAAEFRGRYRSAGSAQQPARGSLEYFLVERYCLFSFDDAFHMYRVDIQHGPWELYLAQAEVEVNTMAEAAGIRLPAVSPLAHFARRQDTVVWPLKRADQE